MALDDFLSTPSGYATKDQIENLRAYSRALQTQSTEPVHHWLQGVNNMVKALSAGYFDNKADKAQMRRQDELASIISGVPDNPISGNSSDALPGSMVAPPSSGFVNPPGPPKMATLPEPSAPGELPVSSDLPPNRASAIASIESGGRYDLLGPVTRTGDRAYGKYQVMGANIPVWTQEALGRKMSPQEFLSSPEAQDAVFQHQFGKYEKQYGNPQDAASMWFTGKPYAEGRTRRDQLGTTGDAYVDRFTKALGTGPSMALSPEPQPSSAPPVIPLPRQPPDLDLGPDAVPAGSSRSPLPSGLPPVKPPGTPSPAPSGGSPMVPGGPVMSPDAAAAVKALTSPGNNVPGRVMAPLPAGLTAAQQAQMIRMGYDLKDVAALATLRQPNLQKDEYGNTWAYTPGQTPQLVHRGPGKFIEENIGNYKTQVVVNVDPATGQLVRQRIGSAPGAVAPQGTPHDVNDPFPTNGDPSAILNWQARHDAHKKGLETFEEKTVTANAAKHQKIEQMAADAQDELPQLQLLQKVVSNPQIYSGLFSEQVAQVDMAGKALGLSSGQTASLIQFAKKLGAAGSLEQIREMGQLGAVRVPEMHMIEKSNYDANNTPEANAAVVELRKRLAERRMEIADMANIYADKNGGRIDRKFDQELRNYYRGKPLVTDDELKKYDELATRKTTSVNPVAAPINSMIPPGHIEYLKTNRSNPKAVSEFDLKYGPGSAAKVLGQ